MPPELPPVFVQEIPAVTTSDWNRSDALLALMVFAVLGVLALVS